MTDQQWEKVKQNLALNQTMQEEKIKQKLGANVDINSIKETLGRSPEVKNLPVGFHYTEESFCYRNKYHHS